jgi:hypothetical protein
MANCFNRKPQSLARQVKTNSGKPKLFNPVPMVLCAQANKLFAQGQLLQTKSCPACAKGLKVFVPDFREKVRVAMVSRNGIAGIFFPSVTLR